jgi:hypothetical protein
MIAFWIAGCLVLLIGGFILYRRISFRKEGAAHEALQMQRVEPLLRKLEDGSAPSAEDVIPLAKDNRTRITVYRALAETNRLDLFPKELLTIEKASEGFLVNWLEFPTELNAAPEAIEHVERVTIDFDGNDVYYHVFKYMTKEPHWAAKNGWMLGVVGPYFTDSKPYDAAGATFSRCDSLWGKVQPKDEAQWVHEHISLRR